MQLTARDRQGTLVYAVEASRSESYQCTECSDPLRLRGGLRRRLHFYHPQKRTTCRQAGKSLTHLQTQLRLQKTLPAGEALLEHPFISIGRIADVYWEKRKIVFEVQCSTISAEEVTARNADYATLGLTVVWILHDRRFSHRRRGEVQRMLRGYPHYYTNIDAKGRGMIYDQVRPFSPKMAVAVSHPIVMPDSLPDKCHPLLHERLSKSSLCFKGDALDLCRLDPLPAFLLKEKRTGRFHKLKRVLNAIVDELILKMERVSY